VGDGVGRDQQRVDAAAEAANDAAGKLLDCFGVTAGALAVQWVIVVEGMTPNGPVAMWAGGAPDGFTGATSRILGLLEYARIEVADQQRAMRHTWDEDRGDD
jgi:hypothetical protein